MKGSIGLLVLVGGVICAATGCKDSDSISGVPASTPTRTPAPAVSQWDVTYQVVADAGPDFCFYTPKLGEAGHEFYTISISRVDNTVSFIPADYGGEPPDQSWIYTGTLQGTSFTATTPPYFPKGACAPVSSWSSLSGSFSADGTRLTATSISFITLDSGLIKTLTFQWSAVRL